MKTEGLCAQILVGFFQLSIKELLVNKNVTFFYKDFLKLTLKLLGFVCVCVCVRFVVDDYLVGFAFKFYSKAICWLGIPFWDTFHTVAPTF